ncbi:hypothetical protein SAMN04487904_102460 [Actinopolyspora lacussalsi subsp. righensis]|uniref:Minimal CRISPR polymerase domain-containing protein n=2 Tax=Actinopolyspora righensis TaxID=995060 RepID=A0A1I6YER5_9ACTN|nr:hypothetical protein SAMN04487904_102460 [Actinopolyspora righensis]
MGIIAALFWYKNKRKYGVGVYISLPSKNDKTREKYPPLSIRKTMDRSHRDWFIYGPDKLTNSEIERANWVIDTIGYRIEEAKTKNQEDHPLFFYIHSRLPEAFAVGQKAAILWDRDVYPEENYDSSWYALDIDFRVRSFARYNRSERIYELNLREIFNGYSSELNSDPGYRWFDNIDLKEIRSYRDLAPLKRSQLAVILHIEHVEGSSRAFRDSAALASAGVANNGYLVTGEDECDEAVFFSVGAKQFFQKLQNGEAESIVRNILHTCQKYSARVYGRQDNPVRLLTNAPSVFAFAAGAYFPMNSKLIRYSQDRDGPEYTESSDLIAIIDGDDVGAQTESSLLSRDLETAVEWSNKADKSLRNIVQKVIEVSGVYLVSSGGDSAIFALPKSALPVFLETLEYLREETGFRVSCGYGADSREAFVSLRIAKNSGKNVSIGA